MSEKKGQISPGTGLAQLLSLVLLTGLVLGAFRSMLVPDVIGSLVWPVCSGFLAFRMAGRNVILGGTLGGIVGFLAMGCLPPGGTFVATVFSRWPMHLFAGVCWGFYLSIWIYMIVETALQLC